MRDDVTVFRRAGWGARIAAPWAVFGSLGLLGALRGGTSPKVSDAVIGSVFFLTSLWQGVRSFRSGTIVSTPTALVARQPFRTRRFAWQELASARLEKRPSAWGQQGDTLVLDLQAGTTITIGDQWARVGTPAATRLADACEQINRAIRDHAGPDP